MHTDELEQRERQRMVSNMHLNLASTTCAADEKGEDVRCHVWLQNPTKQFYSSNTGSDDQASDFSDCSALNTDLRLVNKNYKTPKTKNGVKKSKGSGLRSCKGLVAPSEDSRDAQQ